MPAHHSMRRWQPHAIGCNSKTLVRLYLLTTLFILLAQAKSTTGEQETVQQPSYEEPDSLRRDATFHENPQQQSDLNKILIPDLPRKQYKFWLRNHPLAYENFKRICHTLKEHPSLLGDAQQFAAIHSNLTLENGRFLSDFNYSRQFTVATCLDIDDVLNYCWGYEIDCKFIYLMPNCSDTSPDRQFDQKLAWFNQSDMGYIIAKRREMGAFCALDRYSNEAAKSSLHCSKNFATCYGYNLSIKFPAKLPASSVIQETELFNEGDVGGWNCDLQIKRISEEDGAQGPLQSWYREFRKYQKLKPSDHCDVIIDKPTFLVQLDKPSNMYHYFGTFLNLYATMHLNNYLNSDNQIIVWESTKPLNSSEVWRAFSTNPVKSLGDFAGKRVCFRKFYSALPPRVVGGFYYGAQPPNGCSKSGLFDAFNKHVLHRLNIQQYYIPGQAEPDKDIVRITILDRSSAKNRRLLNAIELLNDTRSRNSTFRVKLLDFEKIGFTQQLEIIHNTDILIGIHGAELTHTLFLPDWAALLELHDCNDKRYGDLARLRGVKYFSVVKDQEVFQKVPVEDGQKPLADKPDMGTKSMDFRLADVEAILELIDKAARRVTQDRTLHFVTSAKELAMIERQLVLAPIIDIHHQSVETTEATTATPAPTKTSSLGPIKPETPAVERSSKSSSTTPAPTEILEDAPLADENSLRADQQAGNLELDQKRAKFSQEEDEYRRHVAERFPHAKPDDQFGMKFKRGFRGILSNRASDQRAPNEASKSSEDALPSSPPTPNTPSRVPTAGFRQDAPPAEPNAAQLPEMEPPSMGSVGGVSHEEL